MSAFIIDTETTGLVEPQPVEIAWLRLDSPQSLVVTEAFCVRYRPSKPISLGALATHHIMDEDLVNCESYTAFRLPEGAEYLIGHNVDYDWEAIVKPDVKRIDTCALSRKLWPQADSHSQGAMLYLNERRTARDHLYRAHSAIVDAWNCSRLLRHILAALGNPASWQELWALSEAARVPETMPYGKHKGTPIKDVPADYKRWLLG